LPEILVIQRSESFTSVWPALAEDLGLDLALSHEVPDAGALTEVLAIIVSAAGVEEEAEPVVRALAGDPRLAPLVVGASDDYHLAVTLMRAGAQHYFALPADLERLRSDLLDRSAGNAQAAARASLAAAQRGKFDFSRIIGESESLRATLDRASRIIPRDRATVLITGETGTGKELLAQAIHFNGPRASAPFVEVNCTAIPANLLEAELFGFEKGAFTDARTAKPGLFESANGGTLFLDEIGNLPYDLQGKILKALEEKHIRRIGALRTISVDLRIMAATHVDLAAAVRAGEFREDLYYRLSVVPLHLPPLRERGDDAILLATHFLHTLAEQYGLPAAPPSPAMRRAIASHSWPGNVRELRNSIERALLLSEGEPSVADLFQGEPIASAGAGTIPFPASIAEMEVAAAHAMVAHTGGNKLAAAKALGISRAKLYRLLSEDSVSSADTLSDE
jgi:DNA-binding NtrC family response regulator